MSELRGGLLELDACLDALARLAECWLPSGSSSRIVLDLEQPGTPLVPPRGDQPLAVWVITFPDGVTPPAELEELASRLATLLEPTLLLARIERDALTGLPGRRLLQALMGRWAGGPAGLLLLDIDRLSDLNRQYGCEGGDEALRRVAALIEDHRPEGALLARYGGDEFSLFWPRCDREQLEQLADALLGSPRSPGMQHTTLSIGLAHSETELDALFTQAEAALSHSLEQGGARRAWWRAELPVGPERIDRLAGLLSGDWGQDYRNVSLLLQLLEGSNASVEAETILTTVLDWMVELSGTERGILFLANGEDLELRLARDRERQTIEGEVPHSRSLVDQALQTGRSVSLADARGAGSDVSRSVHALGLHAVLCVPIRARGQSRVQGVLYMDGVRQGIFTPADVQFFEALARQLCAVLERARLQEEVEQLQGRLRQRLEDTTAALAQARQELAGKYRYDDIVTRSPLMRTLLERLDRVARTDVPVLIEGESGTGKELVARALHHNGLRANGPFIAENCGALQDTLLESELFGHKQGAFTGANSDRTGLLAQADQGTLFLDEVGEMSLGLQKKLLRFLQEGEYRPIGASEVQHADVRVVSATHRNLEQEVAEGRFRTDLYYRLNVVRLELPPLRQRPEDVPLLVEHFLAKHAELLGRPVPALSPEVTEQLIAHHWPGNVRELENVVQRALVLSPGALRVEDLALTRLTADASGLSVDPSLGLNEALSRLEQLLIRRALDDSGGNRSQAARQLGIPRTTLLDRIRKYALEEED